MAPKSKKKNSTPESDKSKNNNVVASASRDPRSKTAIKPICRFSYEDIANMVNLNEEEYDSGRFAKVYKGTYKFKEIAVKQYPPDFENQAQKEIEVFSALKGYRHIVPLIGFCEHSNYYLVMDFIPTNLEKLLKGVDLNWHVTLHILTQLAWSIKALIEQDYVVGDIKPDNILIDHEYTVYLSDFGSAAKAGQRIPTINYQYASKELLKGEGDQSKADIYSFGVIVLQMIMKCDDFGDVDHTSTMEEEMKNVGGQRKGKNRKKEKNTSNKPNYHISIKARIEGSNHVVDRELLNSGCDQEDAQKISMIGINCTTDHVNQRPEIDEIISTLEGMKNKSMMKQLKI